MYHTLIETQSKRTRHQLIGRGRRLIKARSLMNVAKLLKTTPPRLIKIARYPGYNSYYIPKPHGGQRLIQEPAKIVKRLQDRLAAFLQGAYHQCMPEAAYGFILGAVDMEEPRNVYTNARRHLQARWVLNVDLKDFFHQLKTKQVEQLFLAPPFRMSRGAARALSWLSTYEGRLPMGAPSSPVLSNWLTLDLDSRLAGLAHKRGWCYTRYADDLTFSGPKAFSGQMIDHIQDIIRDEGLTVNPQKVRHQARKERPKVTGLRLLPRGIDVGQGYLQEILDDLRVMEALFDPRMQQAGIFDKRPVKKLRQRIQGQLNFLAFVRGEADPDLLALRTRLDATPRKLTPPKKTAR